MITKSNRKWSLGGCRHEHGIISCTWLLWVFLHGPCISWEKILMFSGKFPGGVCRVRTQSHLLGFLTFPWVGGKTPRQASCTFLQWMLHCGKQSAGLWAGCQALRSSEKMASFNGRFHPLKPITSSLPEPSWFHYRKLEWNDVRFVP